MEEMSRLRPDEMTSAERMDALLKGKPIDRVPLTNFGIREFCARNVGYAIADVYSNAEKCFQAQVWTMEQYGFQIEPNLAYASYGAWEFGGDVKLPGGEWEQAPQIKHVPVESEEDAWNLTLPDVTKAGMLPTMMQFSGILDKNNLPIQPCVSPPFTTVGNICGVERLCRWMYKKPEIVHHLLRLATEHAVEVMKHWVNTFGTENVYAREGAATESNQIISPKHFEKFVLPYEKELHERILAMGIKRFFNCHICGDEELNLPYWAQVPMGELGLVSFDHDVDLTTAIKYFGDTCIIAGNISTSVLQTGTPKEVYGLARQCIEKGKQAPRGFMLSAGCGVPPMAPPYNVYMMRKAINDFGLYN